MAAILVACAGERSAAQPVARSQLGAVRQTVAAARIEIVYRRPVARGRELFGGIVPWGRPWTPSADSAATFETTAPLQVAGSSLRAGRYSIWMIPDREMWTIIFSSAQPAFHLPYPAGRDVLRVRVAPRTGDHMETLGFYFPLVDADSAVLNMHWGKTVVPLTIKVAR